MIKIWLQRLGNFIRAEIIGITGNVKELWFNGLAFKRYCEDLEMKGYQVETVERE
jgi:hypothetical protein